MLPTPVKSSKTTDLVLPSDDELFSIDLMGTQLEFNLPKRTLNSSEFLRGHPIDLRPYVNTISKSEYRYNPETKRGSCEFYESGWGIYTKKWWKKHNHGTLKFLVSLETPASTELETFPNMFDEDCLKSWLPLYYRDRQAILERTSFSTLDDGSIEVLTTAEDYVAVKQAMTDAGLEPEDSELTMRASANAELAVEDAQKVLRLVDLLENSDDVQDVFYNADIPEEAYEAEA